MKAFYLGVIPLFIASCGAESKTVEDIIVLPDNEIVLEQEVEQIEQPSNVVTPEHWENFDTDIELTIMFYKGDSLMDFERNIVDGLKEEFSTLDFHEFYTDDNIAQVFINDTLAFDISNFIMEKSYGFVLLKPGIAPHYEFLDDSLMTLKDNFHEFYGNK